MTETPSAAEVARWQAENAARKAQKEQKSAGQQQWKPEGSRDQVSHPDKSVVRPSGMPTGTVASGSVGRSPESRRRGG